ncbi:MAG: DMT family transporter [Maritimibacter sp.]
MDEKQNLNASGVALLLMISLTLGVNQVVIKIVNDGLSPIFSAGLRSVGAAFVVWGWMRFRALPITFRKGTIGLGVLIGVIFAIEFIFLFVALDLTTVTRTSVIFYSMPVWMAIAAHFLLPGERLTRVKTVGLLLAFGGVAWAIMDRESAGGAASLVGDLFALGGALAWMGVALVARMTRLSEVSSEMQMFWQVLVSGPILLAVAPFYGPLIRDLQPIHLWGLAYQSIFVAAASFLIWFWLINRFKASAVASFSFLSPVIGVAAGWLVLGEALSPSLVLKLALVAVGIVLINRAPRLAA